MFLKQKSLLNNHTVDTAKQPELKLILSTVFMT